MESRNDLLGRAVDECMKEAYSFAQPSVTWDEFEEQNKAYSRHYKRWQEYNRAYNDREKHPEIWEKYKNAFELFNWEGKTITECIGPRPYEFYYLPNEIFKDIVEHYVYLYRINHQQELLNTIEILKDYCRKPIVDKWIKGDEDSPGYRGYDHPDNLEKELQTKLREKAGFSVTNTGIENLSKELQDKFFEFLDMAGDFYNWNSELNAFYTSTYLSCSPYSNKNTVIENWKKYRNKDIEINEEQIKKEYYGEELD